MKMAIVVISTVILVVLSLDLVAGHGMVMSPVARGSRWRLDTSAPINYNDNGNFCGGFYVGINYILK